MAGPAHPAHRQTFATSSFDGKVPLPEWEVVNQPSPGSPAPGLGDPVAAMFAEPDDEPAGGDESNLVLAAGAICWRLGQDGAGLELLLVRSARWGDWSWPKGKLEAGESLPECAVREVLEETGVRVTLGVPLPTVSYVLPDGRDKAVRYWAGQVLDQTPQSPDAAELTDVAWL